MGPTPPCRRAYELTAWHDGYPQLAAAAASASAVQPTAGKCRARAAGTGAPARICLESLSLSLSLSLPRALSASLASLPRPLTGRGGLMSREVDTRAGFERTCTVPFTACGIWSTYCGLMRALMSSSRIFVK
jgi:hypothetical protein